ncbi:MAG TPA: hypothetical protein VGG94_06910, partial [Chthoniobacterales bacterium]
MLRRHFFIPALALSCALAAMGGGLPLPVDEGGSTSAPSAPWFKTIFSSGEYVAEETYVGEASVRRGSEHVDDYDEHDTALRFILTPRVKFGVLRLGVQWERFSFGFPDNTPLPNTLQSGALVIGLDTQFSDS